MHLLRYNTINFYLEKTKKYFQLISCNKQWRREGARGASAPGGRGVARNLFRRGTKQGEWGQKSPSLVQGHIQSPGGDLGAKLKI